MANFLKELEYGKGAAVLARIMPLLPADMGRKILENEKDPFLPVAVSDMVCFYVGLYSPRLAGTHGATVEGMLDRMRSAGVEVDRIFTDNLGKLPFDKTQFTYDGPNGHHVVPLTRTLPVDFDAAKRHLAQRRFAPGSLARLCAHALVFPDDVTSGQILALDSVVKITGRRHFVPTLQRRGGVTRLLPRWLDDPHEGRFDEHDRFIVIP